MHVKNGKEFEAHEKVTVHPAKTGQVRIRGNGLYFLPNPRNYKVLYYLPVIRDHRYFFGGYHMKKFISVVLICTLLFCLAACGETTQAQKGPGAYVTITTADGVALASAYTQLVDNDKDGTITIEEVLLQAHKDHAPNKDTDFECIDSDYGRSMVRLWGDTSMSYGYYLNNNIAWSPTDPVAEDDYLCAFVYRDQSAWSDVYAWFDYNNLEVRENTFSLCLGGYTSYDTNMNPVQNPIAGAKIFIDGKESEFMTEADGSVKISGLSKGSHVISAASDEFTLSGAVCRIEVK